MSGWRSTSSDLVTGKKFIKKLLYVQHVDKEKDTTSEITELFLLENLLVDRKLFSDLNFTEHLNNPKGNLSTLKSSLEDRITLVTVYSNPISTFTLQSKVVIHAFVVFETWNNSNRNVTWWSIEKSGTYIVLQQSHNKYDVTKKIYDVIKKENVKRLEPVKKLRSALGNQRDLQYLLQVIWDTNQINKQYNFLISNCHNFASWVFEKSSSNGNKWSTAITAIVDRFKFRNKITAIQVDADKYKSIVNNSKFDYYRAMIERRREDFEELASNLTVESLNSVDSQGYTLLEWATVFSTSNWPIDEELMKKGAIIPSKQGLFRRNVFFIALQYLPFDEEFKRNSTKFMSLNGIDINGVNQTGDTALHLALYGDKWEIAEKILKRFEDNNVNVTNSIGDTPLHLAAKLNCEFDLFKSILDRTNSENINKADGNGCTALHWVVRARSTEKIKLLLNKRIDVNAQDFNGDTVLHSALYAKLKPTLIMNLLKQVKRVDNQCVEAADVNIKNKNNLTVLHCACFHTNISADLFKKILERSADINAQNVKGDTALHCAISEESKTAVEELLTQKHIDVNVTNNNNRTALHLAIRWTNIPVHLFKMILEKSGDVNAKDRDGNTALHLAIGKKNQTAVEKLLKHKDVDVNVRDHSCWTALDFACEWPDIPVHLFKMILQKSADINAQDHKGNTALHYAIMKKFESAVKELLEHKDVDVNVKNNNNLTALHLAIRWTDIPVDLFKMILQNSADINAKDIDGRTALHIAIMTQSEIAVKELLAHKYVDVNVKNNDNLTALHYSCTWLNIPVHLFQKILKKSADINAQDKDGDTPLNYALKNESADSAMQLLRMESVDVNIKNKENEMAIDLADGWPTIPVHLLKLIRDKTKNINVSVNIGTTVGHHLDQHEKEGNIQLHFADDGRYETRQKRQHRRDSGVYEELSRSTTPPSSPIIKFTDVIVEDTPHQCALPKRAENVVEELLQNEADDETVTDKNDNYLACDASPDSEMLMPNRTKIEVNVKENDVGMPHPPVPTDMAITGTMETRSEKIKIDRRQILGMGSYSTVFLGSLNGREVAVKRIQLPRVEIMLREEEIIRILKHPNVIELLAVEEDDDFRYYAFELAAGTLYEFCQGYFKGPMPSDGEALKQMTEGLRYIHDKNFVHRDIKPSNILISMNQPVRLKFADFGLCKATTNRGTYSMGSGNKGTELWMAPEMFGYPYADDDDSEQSGKRFSIESDTWALGCLFFYFLTRGIHPFGKNVRKIRYNIIVEQRPVELEQTMQSSNSEMVKVYKLIRNMIEKEPQKRIALERVLIGLNEIYPNDLDSNQRSAETRSEMSTTPTEPMENDSTTEMGQGNKGSSQQTENDNAANHVEARNADRTNENGKETPGPSNRGRENQDNSGGGNGKQKDDCCMFCKVKIAKLESDCGELNRSKGNTAEKIGHVNESLIRTNLGSNENGKTRNISSLYQLVKCYGEARRETWTETDTYDNCKRITKHLIEIKSESNFCFWYYEQAVNSLKNKVKCFENKMQNTTDPKEEKFEMHRNTYKKNLEEMEKTSPTKITNKNSNIQFKVAWKFGAHQKTVTGDFIHPSTHSEFSKFSSQELLNAMLEMTKEKEKLKDQSAKSDQEMKKKPPSPPQYEIVKFYKKNRFTNYIPGPIENWDEYTKPNSPIFLLALYESIKHDENLLSFPPPGILTMDVPVKISCGISLLPPTPENINGNQSPENINGNQSLEENNENQSPEENNENQTPEENNENQSPKNINAVIIEVGEIKSSDGATEKAKLQLRRSLLCFKWMDQKIAQVDAFYVLIGNLYIEGNSSEAQKKPENEKKLKPEFIHREGITFKTRYVEYK